MLAVLTFAFPLTVLTHLWGSFQGPPATWPWRFGEPVPRRPTPELHR